jgi:hypothetical protein
MPAIGTPEDRADAYARINVKLPTALTPEQREHYAALRRLEQQP